MNAEHGKIVEYNPDDGIPVFARPPLHTLDERRTKLRDAVLSMFTDQPITLTLLRRLEAAIAEHVV